jgi:hypothetical protein
MGLKGQMCLYTLKNQEPWRSKQAGIELWFGPDDTEKMLVEIEKLYNDGALPNSPLLLNPIVHDENKKPLGSGIVWSTGFALGIETMKPRERINSLNVFSGIMERGEVKNAGLKMVGFLKKALPALEDGVTVEGCRELFEVANFSNNEYYRFYLLSGLTYLGKHGGFLHPDFREIVPEKVEVSKIVSTQQAETQLIKDAFLCWEAYDRHHSLYAKFGVDPERVENNLRFYNMCARDVELFDATGSKHVASDTAVSFDFIVDGWLPRGAVTIIGASGGTGKSSLAHNLAVKASIDYEKDEPPPTWLGSKINLELCKGLCIYFSGEDGPAIVHARASIPTSAKAARLQPSSNGSCSCRKCRSSSSTRHENTLPAMKTMLPSSVSFSRPSRSSPSARMRLCSLCTIWLKAQNPSTCSISTTSCAARRCSSTARAW